MHNYGSEPEMTEIDIDRLSDIEDFKAILKLHDEAKEFLEDHIWCKKTLKSWYDFGIADKIGIFLFQIEPNNSETDSFIWVIVGDLPSVYLDQSVITGQEALKTYCELMTEWSDNILKGNSIDDCYPVTAAATIENAELLTKRINFIKTNLLNEEKE